MGGQFLTVGQIVTKHEDIGRATLHGTPPGDWFQRWMDDIAAMRGALGRAEAANAHLRTVLQGLVTRLDEMEDPLNACLFSAQIHGHPYPGPTWETQMAAARAALTTEEPCG